ncbi:hypothetical protein [Lysinibacillus sp. NPDC047702]|uniref:hypothetical protein n=1 Tax=unclassified Lysinibacillus TaxID=2636778 RepID=UPI003D0668A8
MFIKFNQYELLELFEKEPVFVGDEEAGILIYSKSDDLGFKLVLTISIYEKQCNLSLSYQKFDASIFEIKLIDVDEIVGEDQILTIIGRNIKNRVEVIFNTHFKIKI